MFAIPAAIGTAVCLYLYLSESASAGELVGGGSFSGLVCGVAAGAVIVFEMLLWPRKAFRRLRLIPAKYWLAAHVWFGIASLPLAIAHCGLHLGGWLPATFMVLFVLTILSGLYGLAVQNLLPKWMLRNLPSETIYSQIDYVSDQTVRDARRLLVTVCGRPSSAADLLEDEPELAKSNTIVVGAVRQAGKTRGRTLETRQVTNAFDDQQQLWNALDEIQPFLLEGRRTETPVTNPQQSAQWFRKLRTVCGSESESTIDILEGMCDQRRQFDTQQTVHRWLHAWLPVHIGLSVAVSVLLAAHVWTALKYW
ncbi:MAG: hypothetical protein AB8B91_25125 [Rubripirellula sp.]